MDWRLKRRPGGASPEGPVVVVIMDGVGIGKGNEGDAVALARTPILDDLRARYPWRTLRAHGTAVGMPSDGDMGNSEVGHNAIGAGRIFDQGAKLVNHAIAERTLFEGETWKRQIASCLESKTPLHFIGLLSDGNVHSHIDHLIAMIREAARRAIRELYVHPLLDGRDVDKSSAHLYVEQIEAVLSTFDGKDGRRYRIASGGGRMNTTMDRYRANWAVVERGWNAHVHGQGPTFRSTLDAIEHYRSEKPGIIDQDIGAFVIVDEGGKPVGPIGDGSAVIFFNFRGDRAIEISQAFEQEEFPYFDRGRRPNVAYAGMMQYDGDLLIPRSFLVSPPAIDRTMGEYLAKNGVPQFACSETQKYGHVTYFWNGNRGGAFDSEMETYVEIPSDDVPFEQRPWMKAAEITDRTIEELRTGRFRHARINYANGDMVGHTGNLDAVVIAVEAVDLSLGRFLQAIAEMNGIAIVTADHGNADEMFESDKRGRFKIDEETGGVRARTSHSLNPVPFVVVDPATPERHRLREDLPGAGLANIAATTLHLLGFEAPEDYEESLLR